MTIGLIQTAAAPVSASSAQSTRELAEGQQLLLQVIRRVDDRRYLAVFGNQQHLVDSTVDLAVGSRVRAAVVAVGEKLELRYLGTEAPEPERLGSAQDEQSPGNPVLVSLQQRFATSLGAADREVVEKAISQATDPGLMAASGLFLAKLSMPVAPGTLDAVYASQLWVAPKAAGIAVRKMTGSTDDSESLVSLMADALCVDANAAGDLAVSSTPQSAADGADLRGGADLNDRDHARRLLNIQDDGSVGYRFGVLPVIIGDELVELDLAYFRDHHASREGEGMRRMVMTFSSKLLGHVEVAAQAVLDRLSISIKTDSAISSEILATHGADVRDLLIRLGWNVDTIAYDFDPDTRRASSHIVEHVLNADTLSRLL